MAPQQKPPQAPTTLSSSDAPPTESDVYDRQIRLWGAEAQKKMSSAKVLYIHTTSISSEILKNLVLAGVHASIADGRPYPDAMKNVPSSFLPPSERLSENNSGNNNEGEEHETKKVKKMTVAQAMAPHVHELNPLLDECEIHDTTTDIKSIPTDFLKQFDVIVASKISLDDALYISKCANEQKSTFYLVHSFGFYACALIDLGAGHEFRKEIGKELSDIETVKDYIPLHELIGLKLDSIKDRWHKNGPPVIYAKFRCILNYHAIKNQWPDDENSTSVEEFVSLSKSFLREQGLKEDYVGTDEELKTLCVTTNAEVSPVCAVMGGILGNEVIKALSGRGEPANNVLLFDGLDGGCKSFTVKKS